MTRQLSKLFFTLLALAGIVFFVDQYTAHENNFDGLKVWFFDVGQGEATLFDTGNKQVLIDGGPDQSILHNLTRALQLSDKYIDCLIITHNNSDHLRKKHCLVLSFILSCFGLFC